MLIAYTYEADYHCPTCTHKRFPEPDSALDNEGNRVRRVNHYYEWMELDKSFCMENPVQKLICGDCHELLWTYSVGEEVLSRWMREEIKKIHEGGDD